MKPEEGKRSGTKGALRVKALAHLKIVFIFDATDGSLEKIGRDKTPWKMNMATIRRAAASSCMCLVEKRYLLKRRSELARASGPSSNGYYRRFVSSYLGWFSFTNSSSDRLKVNQD